MTPLGGSYGVPLTVDELDNMHIEPGTFTTFHGERFTTEILNITIQHLAEQRDRLYEDARRRAEMTGDDLRALFMLKGWSIQMDERPDQALDPFLELALALGGRGGKATIGG